MLVSRIAFCFLLISLGQVEGLKEVRSSRAAHINHLGEDSTRKGGSTHGGISDVLCAIGDPVVGVYGYRYDRPSTWEHGSIVSFNGPSYTVNFTTREAQDVDAASVKKWGPTCKEVQCAVNDIVMAPYYHHAETQHDDDWYQKQYDQATIASINGSTITLAWVKGAPGALDWDAANVYSIGPSCPTLEELQSRKARLEKKLSAIEKKLKRRKARLQRLKTKRR
jgi:hypothetical protein